MTVNGLTLNRDQLPIDLPPDRHEALGCMEPVLRTLAELNRLIADDTDGKCRLETLDHGGGAVSGNGRCSYKAGDANIGGVLALTGDERPGAVSTRLTADIFVHASTGATEQVRVTSTAAWTRLGDC